MQKLWYESFEATDKLNAPKLSPDRGTLVVIEDYLESEHLLKVRRLNDGKPLIPPISTTEKIVRSQTTGNDNNIKTMKTLAAPDAPIVEVNDHSTSIRGSSNNGFNSFREFGNVVTGPTSFSAQPNEIRISGLMTLHPLLMSGFPSTIVTPIPTMQWSLPTGGMLGPIVKDIALIATLIGAA